MAHVLVEICLENRTTAESMQMARRRSWLVPENGSQLPQMVGAVIYVRVSTNEQTGNLMEGVLAAFAQFDNDVRSDRTRAGMRAALELGRWTFLAPLG